MALATATLSTNMQEMMSATASDGVAGLASAYGAYMAQATNIIGANIPACVTAMKNAMSFPLATAAVGAATMVTGLGAFWGIMAATPANYFAAATLITPPPFTNLADGLVADFVANISGVSLSDSMDALAGTFNGATNGQGTYSTGGPNIAIT